MSKIDIHELVSILTGINKTQSNTLAAIVKRYCKTHDIEVTTYITQRNNNCELNLEFAPDDLINLIYSKLVISES